MHWLLTTIGVGVGVFVATNIDDIFLLTLFFAHVNATFRRRHIVLGHSLGFTGLLAISGLGYVTALIVPRAWIGLLGLVPVGLGLRKLMDRTAQAGTGDRTAAQFGTAGAGPLWRSVLAPQTYSVAAVTLANGGDNIGVYVPLFATSSPAEIAVLVVVFLLLVATWCYAGAILGKHPGISAVLARYGHFIVPVVLIGLGVFILVESGTFALVPGLWRE